MLRLLRYLALIIVGVAVLDGAILAANTDWAVVYALTVVLAGLWLLRRWA